MRTVTTQNLTHAFFEDHEYTIMHDQSMREARVLIDIEDDECVIATNPEIDNIEEAVQWGHQHMRHYVDSQNSAR